MSAKANPTVIGAFVIGGLALSIAGLLVFGSGQFFKQADRYVVFFKGRVDGLNTAAPVTCNGVRVGSVQDVDLLVEAKTKDIYVRVILEVERGKAEYVGGRLPQNDVYPELIRRGLRAQLSTQSMVTGLLSVSLVLDPETPPNLLGLDKRYPEISAIPTDMEKIKNTVSEALGELRKLPVEKLVKNLDETVTGLNKLVNNSDVKNTLSSLSSTMVKIETFVGNLDKHLTPLMGQLESATTDTRKLLANVNAQVGALSPELRSASQALRSALAQTEKTLALKEGVPGKLASRMMAVTGTAEKTLEQATRSLGAVESVGSPDSRLQQEMAESLKELRAAARAIRELADSLQQHPEALLRGKGRTGGD